MCAAQRPNRGRTVQIIGTSSPEPMAPAPDRQARLQVDRRLSCTERGPVFFDDEHFGQSPRFSNPGYVLCTMYYVLHHLDRRMVGPLSFYLANLPKIQHPCPRLSPSRRHRHRHRRDFLIFVAKRVSAN